MKTIVTRKDWENPATMPKFGTILADPPWSILQRGRYGAARHYNLMPLEEIKAMPVGELAANNSHLWLWIPNNLIREGLEVMDAWGFTYRNSFYWIKLNHLGLGKYLRTASETVLFGTRGKALPKIRNQQNWLPAPNQNHSHKPEEMYAIIDRFSPGPYLELFARTRPKNPDWTCWGDETIGGADIYIPGQKDLKQSAEYEERLAQQEGKIVPSSADEDEPSADEEEDA